MTFEKQLIFSLGAGHVQVPYFLEIKKLGFKIIACDRNPKAPGREIVDYFENVSTYDLKRTLQLARKYNGQSPIFKVLALTTGIPVLNTAQINKKLSINGMGIEAARLSVDKFFLRKTLKRLGFSKLKFLKTKDSNRAKRFLAIVGKCVLKPNFGGMGSSWVIKINNSDELTKYFYKVAKSSFDGFAYLEEFFEGDEYKVSTIWNGGQFKFISFEKACFDSKLGIVNGHAMGRLPPNTNFVDKTTLEKLFKLLKLAPGPMGLDLIIGSKGFEVIDFEFVLSDCHIGVSFCANYNLYKNEVGALLGDKVNRFKGFSDACCVRRFLFPEQKIKTVKKIDFQSFGRSNKNVLEVVFDDRVHGRIDTTSDKYQFQGYVITRGQDQKEAMKYSNKIYQNFLSKII